MTETQSEPISSATNTGKNLFVSALIFAETHKDPFIQNSGAVVRQVSLVERRITPVMTSSPFSKPPSHLLQPKGIKKPHRMP